MESTENSTVNIKKKVLFDFRDFFFIPNVFFKSVGYDFMRTTNSKRMRIFLSTICALIVSCHVYLNVHLIRQIFLVNITEHVMDIVRLSSCIAYSLNSNVKFLGFLIHRKLVRHVYDTLMDAYPNTFELKKIYRVNSFYWSKLERGVCLAYIFACWNVVFCPLILSAYMYKDDYIFPFLKCYPVEFVYDYRTPLRYLGVYLVEMVHSHYMIMVNFGTDLWLACFTSQICMHLTYIAHEVERYEPDMTNSKKDCEFLVELIKKHNTMLSLHNNLNTIFGISLAFNLISTTGVLCIVAVRLIVEGPGVEFMAFSIFLINAMAQFYMVCYYGEKLSNLSENIGKAAYMQIWYNSSPAYKKLLIILIIRSQKKAQLSAVGLQPISLETFKTFTGSAYQIFALLQTILDLHF